MNPKTSLSNELKRYIIVGISTVGVDGISYYILTETGITSPHLSKRVSYILGTIWAYFFNKYFTFNKPALEWKEPLLFGSVYLFSFIANGVCHDCILAWTNGPIPAFILATGLSTLLNFLGQKTLVFRHANT